MIMKNNKNLSPKKWRKDVGALEALLTCFFKNDFARNELPFNNLTIAHISRKMIRIDIPLVFGARKSQVSTELKTGKQGG